MAKNPWANDPDLVAMRSSKLAQRGSTPWAGLLVGVALVACGTFIFAYYVPLYRAHQTLASSYGRTMQQIKTLEDTLAQAQASLKAEIAKRETLEAEKRQKDSSSKSASGELEKVKSALAEKLSSPIGKKQAALAVDGGRLVVALSSGALFGTGKLEVSGGGKNMLCEIGKAAGSQPVGVVGATDDGSVPMMLKPKYSDAWALSAGAAASVAATLEDKCSVPGGKLRASGFGEAKAMPKALEGTKIGGLRVEIEIGGGDQKP
jgi:chemotaxis protein MotB